jgi:hypothetical protein
MNSNKSLTISKKDKQIMSEIKVELSEFVNRPNGVEYSYRVYSESHADATFIARNLKWAPDSDKYYRYSNLSEPYLFISETLTTPEELQALVDSLSTETKSETILPEKVEDLGGWLILTLTNKEKTPDLDEAAVTLSWAMVKKYGWSLTSAVKIFACAVSAAIQDKKSPEFSNRIGHLGAVIRDIQKGYN